MPQLPTPGIGWEGRTEINMAGKVNAVREGTHTVTAHLIVRGGKKAVEFYKKAFGAEVKGIHETPDGKVMHAELKVGDEAQAAILKDVQRHPFKNAIVHVDFQRVEENEKIRISIPLHFLVTM